MREQRVKNPQALIDDYKNGMTVLALAKKYDLSEGGVYYYLRAYRVKRDRYNTNKSNEEDPAEKIKRRKIMLQKNKQALINFIMEVITK